MALKLLSGVHVVTGIVQKIHNRVLMYANLKSKQVFRMDSYKIIYFLARLLGPYLVGTISKASIAVVAGFCSS